MESIVNAIKEKKIMSNNMTGKPSIDRPWMKYYPEVLQKMIQIPECTVKEYLKKYCPGEDSI